jgi:nickel-dependent lactate racemase
MASPTGSERVTVVVPDITRPIDYRDALGPVLARLPEATVLVGLGLHRPMSAQELEPLATLCNEHGASLEQHDPGRVVRAPSGASFAPQVVEADRVVCVGVVEPHQYAGFSGGVKGIVIGCGGLDTIGEMHGLPMLRACGARVGWVEGNPFHDRLWELAEGLPPIEGRFIVPGADQCFEGNVRDAHRRATATARKLHFQPVETPVSSMLLRVPATKSASFYQASRAATYAALVERPAIAEGGTLYVDASCPEGLGLGTGEQACSEAMATGRERLLRELEGQATAPPRGGGAQRAYVIALALEHIRIVLVGAPRIPVLEDFGIDQIDGSASAELVVTDPFHHVPVLA